jgi:hypothetical protein
VDVYGSWNSFSVNGSFSIISNDQAILVCRYIQIPNVYGVPVKTLLLLYMFICCCIEAWCHKYDEENTENHKLKIWNYLNSQGYGNL